MPVDQENVATDTELALQTVTVEDIGPARKLLTIEVPQDRIAEKVESNYDKLKDEAAIPGFRKGKAPVKLLERRFGETVRGDVRRQLLTECYTQAIESESLDVIGEPDIKDAEDIEIPEDGPLIFKVEIEVSPQVELPKLDSLKIEKPPFTIEDKDVDEEIEKLLLRVGEVEELRDTKLKAEDVLVADTRILKGKDANDDAEQITHQPEATILVPAKKNEAQGHIMGIPVEGLSKTFTGKKTGETIRLSVQGPAVHEDENIQDQPITIVVQIQKVQRRTPGTVEQVIASAGLESESDLKDRIREMLTARAEREQRSAIHKQICTFLTDKVKIELPENMTARQTARILRKQAMEMAYQGMDREQIEQKVSELRQNSEDQAKEQLQLFFILDQAAKTLDIEVTEAELNGQIAMLAQQQGRRPEKLRQQMQKQGEIDHLYLMIREQKTLDAILEKADVKTTESKAKSTKKEAGDKPESTKKKTTKKKSTTASDSGKSKKAPAKTKTGSAKSDDKTKTKSPDKSASKSDGKSGSSKKKAE